MGFMFHVTGLMLELVYTPALNGCSRGGGPELKHPSLTSDNFPAVWIVTVEAPANTRPSKSTRIIFQGLDCSQ